MTQLALFSSPLHDSGHGDLYDCCERWILNQKDNSLNHWVWPLRLQSDSLRRLTRVHIMR